MDINDATAKGLDDLFSDFGLKPKSTTPTENPRTVSDVPLDMYLLGPDDEVVEPPPVMMYTTQDGKTYPIMSRGDISVVKGPPKARKTFLTSMLAAAVTNHYADHFGLSSAPDEKKNKVLFIDTEQSMKHARRVVRRILLMSGSDPDRLMYVPLRRADIPSRIQIIEKFLKEKSKEISLVVIDGVRDLVLDFNDISQSNHVVQLLMKWSSEYDVHISVVIHTNKGDKNSRGHLGAELDNKSELVLLCVEDPKNPDVTTVSTAITRGYRTDNFNFIVEDTNTTKYGDLGFPLVPGADAFVDPEYTFVAMTKFMQRAFNGDEELSSNDLRDRLNGLGVGKDKAKRYVKCANELGVISKGNNKAPFRLLVNGGPVNLIKDL